MNLEAEEACFRAGAAGFLCVDRICCRGAGRRWRRRHDFPPPLRCRPEDAVIAHEVRPRRWNQRGQATQQLARLEDEDLAAIAEAALHAIGELAIGKGGEPLLREGRSGSIAAQVSQALAVVRVQMDAGVQREALVVGRELLGRVCIRRPAPKRRDGLGLGRGERVRLPGVLPKGVQAGREERADAAFEAMHDLGDILVGEGRKRHEADRAAFAAPHTVGDHAVEVHVQQQHSLIPCR